ncbi:MAG: FAD-dependent oxidoreductase [candidate division Zixibacteria bacterium]|nr:FAD-dependent oxidoreductase [candidate division Zixibacteria bacterium]
MDSVTKSDVVIVGGVAAGPKTAATLMRRNPKVKVTLFQKEEQLSYATCGMPYFASGDVDNFQKLTLTSYGVVRDAEFFENTKGFEAVTGAEVLSIDRAKKIVTVRMITNGTTFEHGYDKLVLATGATAAKVPFSVDDGPNIRTFTSPEDAITFRKLAQTGQIEAATIIGGGFIGCEVAEAAGGLWGIETTLIEREDQLLPYVLDPEMAALVKAEMIGQGINVLTGATVEKVAVIDGKATISVSENEDIDSDYVFMCLGVKPMTELASGCGLELGSTGGIRVDAQMRTSDPDIFAGGDCVESIHQLTGKEVFMPMGSLANRHGRIIAENIVGNDASFPGVLGAFLVKIFDLNVGAVGLSERAAVADGMDIQTVWGAFLDKPDYYPENNNVFLKMVYATESRQLLGLQAVGKGDITRRVDVFSSFLQRKATINDLLDFEHGYAPPYGEALDPLHHLAGMALAQEKGMEFVGPGEGLVQFANAIWLDVREIAEVEAMPINVGVDVADLLHIKLGDLKNGLDKINHDKPILVFCRRGPRSYQAALQLKTAGFDNVVVLGGGTTGLPETEEAE